MLQRRKSVEERNEQIAGSVLETSVRVEQRQ